MMARKYNGDICPINISPVDYIIYSDATLGGWRRGMINKPRPLADDIFCILTFTSINPFVPNVPFLYPLKT